MQDALTVLRIHASPEWKAWLGSMLVDNPNGLGSELVMALRGSDNPARADTLLEAATRLGWIERTGYAPSVEQQFFGVGGVPGSALDTSKASSVKGFHGQLWMFRIIDRAAVEAHVGDAKPERATYVTSDAVKYRPAFVAQIQGGTRMRKMLGRVVGFSTLRTDDGVPFPRVAWDADPNDEPACQAPVDEPPRCRDAGSKGALHVCSCPRVPYRARPVHPANIVKADR